MKPKHLMITGVVLILIELILPRVSLSLTASLGLIPIIGFAVCVLMLAIGALRWCVAKMKA